MTCLNLGKKGYVSFDWGDASANNNDKTPPMTRRRIRGTRPQEVTPLPKTTKQQQLQDVANNNFGNEAPKPRRQQQQQDSNNDNNDNNDETPTSKIWQ